MPQMNNKDDPARFTGGQDLRADVAPPRSERACRGKVDGLRTSSSEQPKTPDAFVRETAANSPGDLAPSDPAYRDLRRRKKCCTDKIERRAFARSGGQAQASDEYSGLSDAQGMKTVGGSW